MRKRDYLTGTELSPGETEALLARALEMKKDGKPSEILAGKTFTLLFEKHSTRTRVSFEAGIAQLGGTGIFLTTKETQLGRGETIADSAKVLGRYTDGIIIRTYGHDRIEEFAENAAVPVINALTDLHHPCQALADVLTLREKFGKMKGLKIAYLGDGNNVLHSLLLVAAPLGISVSAACPPPYHPDSGVVDEALALAAGSGATIYIGDSIEEACRGAHAIYTDVWTSMGQEEEAAERRRRLLPYQVHGEVFHGADRNAVFMHCLPAHRGEEVTAEIIDGPRSVVFDQAENRLHAQKALLELLVGAENA
ncbi:MAG: ornithine carbamoyltransferase [bacterium]|nr:ornithine carbamoyltransferase [bacterium]